MKEYQQQRGQIYFFKVPYRCQIRDFIQKDDFECKKTT